MIEDDMMKYKLIWIVLFVVCLEGVWGADVRNKKMNSMNANQEVTVRLLNEKGELTPPQKVSKVVKTDAEWKAMLTPEQYRITRGQGTEQAFCGIFHDNKKQGIYLCVGCGLPLFRSDAKFESGTGWPSFFQPVAAENIGETKDVSHGMTRIEIHCARCNGHLGHVFNDGPRPTGLRYCLNSDAMTFVEKKPAVTDSKSQREKAMFGAGCFWGVEETFRQMKGVTSTAVGYSGGKTKNPTYKEVCADTTGHAEVVQVEYDPSQVSYDQLLEVFWNNHNPTTLNRQGPDVGTQYRSAILGTQYRSAIFFYSKEQEAAAKASIEKLSKSGKFPRPIVTKIEQAREFYRAEEYHQQYLSKRGMGSCHIQ
jgi:peptide methionine sulfoxide reductase msrA/msrB